MGTDIPNNSDLADPLPPALPSPRTFDLALGIVLGDDTSQASSQLILASPGKPLTISAPACVSEPC